VNILRSASPENRVTLLAPPSPLSCPVPVDWRCSSAATSPGELDVIVRPVSRSYQRKAGMFSLLPSSSPAWLALVCDDRSHSHSISRWPPVRSQRASVGAYPSRSARRRTSLDSPSISRNRTPGTSDTSISPRRRSWRTVRRWRAIASSSTPNTPASTRLAAVNATTSTIVSYSHTCSSTVTLTAAVTSMVLRTRPASPSVHTLSTSVTRESTGQTTALIAMISAAVSSGEPEPRRAPPPPRRSTTPAPRASSRVCSGSSGEP
jgi:hypothetical protein